MKQKISWDKIKKVCRELATQIKEKEEKITLMVAPLKKFFDDKKLKNLGLYTSNPHINDSLRHGLYYLKFSKK